LFRVDDNFPDCKKVEMLEVNHPKLYLKCIALWLFGGCYSARNGLDGVVSDHVVRKLVPFKNAVTCAQALVDVGLWRVVEGGYQYHDYSDWNETKQQKTERLRKDRERQQAFRARGKPAPVTRDTKRDVTCDSQKPTNTNTSTNTSTNLKKKNNKKKLEVSSEVNEVFECWQQVHNHPHSRLDAKRKTRITDRLQEGYTAASLCDALRGAKHDEWLQGGNPDGKIYSELQTILREAATVDRHLETWEQHRHEAEVQKLTAQLGQAYDACETATRNHGRDSDEYRTARARADDIERQRGGGATTAQN